MDSAILQFFESIRNPALTVFFGLFSALGEAAVISAIVLIFYWLTPRKDGEQALVTVLTSFCLNAYMKYTAARPRPYTAGVVQKLDPPLGAALDGYASFPSGHTQMTAGFFGSVASRSKRVLVRILCGLTVLLIMLSRLYFGVHYPTDVLAGLFCGILLALLWALVYRIAYDYRYLVLLGFAFISLLPVFSSPAYDYLQAAGILSGAAVGLTFLHFSANGTEAALPRSLWRIPVGMSILAAVFMLTLFFPKGDAYTLLKWFLLAFAGIFGGQHAFERLQI